MDLEYSYSLIFNLLNDVSSSQILFQFILFFVIGFKLNLIAVILNITLTAEWSLFIPSFEVAQLLTLLKSYKQQRKLSRMWAVW